MKNTLLTILIGLILLTMGCTNIGQPIIEAATPAPEVITTPVPTLEATSEPIEVSTQEPVVQLDSEPTEEPTSVPTPEPTAEPTPTPTPEPVITFSEYRYPVNNGDVSEGYIYVSEDFKDQIGSLYVFCGENGGYEWRIYAERDCFEDGVLKETQSGFLKANVGSVIIRFAGEPSYEVEPDEEAGFVLYESELFGTPSLTDDAKAKYTVSGVSYGTYDTGDHPTYVHLFGGVGEEMKGAIPVVTEKDGCVRFYVPGGDAVLLGKFEVKKR